jgi:hypothetical protein
VNHAELRPWFATWFRLHPRSTRRRTRGTFNAYSAARTRGEIRVALDLLDQLDRDGLSLATLGQDHVDRWPAAGPARRQRIRFFVA